MPRDYRSQKQSQLNTSTHRTRKPSAAAVAGGGGDELLAQARHQLVEQVQNNKCLLQQNRQLQDALSATQRQCNATQQKLNKTEQLLHCDQLQHQHHMDIVNTQLDNDGRTRLAANVDTIRLQRRLKSSAEQLQQLRHKLHSVEAALTAERASRQQLSKQHEEATARVLKTEAQLERVRLQCCSQVTQLQHQLQCQQLTANNMQEENKLLRSANENLSSTGSESDWLELQRHHSGTVATMRDKLTAMETDLKAERARYLLLEAQLTSERQQRSWRQNHELTPSTVSVAVQASSEPHVSSNGAHVIKENELDPAVNDNTLQQSAPEKTASNVNLHDNSTILLPTPVLDVFNKIDSGQDVREQLVTLHGQYVDALHHHTQQQALLETQHTAKNQLQKQVDLLNFRLQEVQTADDARANRLQMALQSRSERIKQLETKLRDVSYRVGVEHSSSSNHTVSPFSAHSLFVPNNTGTLTLHIDSVCLTPHAQQQLSSRTCLLVWLFYDQLMSFTSVVRADAIVKFNCSHLYRVPLCSKLIDYLRHESVRVQMYTVVDEERGDPCDQATLSLADVLAFPRNKLLGAVEMDHVGTLHYWLTVDDAVQHFLTSHKHTVVNNNNNTHNNITNSPNQDTIENTGDIKPQLEHAPSQLVRDSVTSHYRQRDVTAVGGACRNRPRPAPRSARTVSDLDNLSQQTYNIDNVSGSCVSVESGSVALSAVRANDELGGAGDLTYGAGDLTYGGEDLTYGGGNLTDGGGNLTDGGGNLTDGGGNLTDGAGDLTYGAGDLTYGGGNLTDGGGDLTYGQSPTGSCDADAPRLSTSQDAASGAEGACEPTAGCENSGETNSSYSVQGDIRLDGTDPCPRILSVLDHSSVEDDEDIEDDQLQREACQLLAEADLSLCRSPLPDDELTCAQVLQVHADVHTEAGASSGTDSEGVVVHRRFSRSPASVIEPSSSVPSEESITITVAWLSFHAHAAIYRQDFRPLLFVEYRLADLPREQLESPVSLPLANAGQLMVFDFSKEIALDRERHAHRRRLLAELLLPESTLTSDPADGEGRLLGGGAVSPEMASGSVRFTIVAEPPENVDNEAVVCTDIGNALLSLRRLACSRLIHTASTVVELDVLGVAPSSGHKDNHKASALVIGRLCVRVHGVHVLRRIMHEYGGNDALTINANNVDDNSAETDK